MIDKKIRAEWLNKVKNDGDELVNADSSLQKDKEIVLAAVTNDGSAIQYADDSLQKDKEIVLAAVQNGSALQYADESLQKDKEIVLAAVTNDGSAIQYADDSLKKVKEIVLAAVQNGYALRYADTSLQKDKEIVLAAVTNNGFALRYADESLQKDKEIVLAAVQNGSALRYADESLQKDKEIVSAAEMDQDKKIGFKERELVLKNSEDIMTLFVNYFDLAEEVEEENDLDWAKNLYVEALKYIEYAEEWWDDFYNIFDQVKDRDYLKQFIDLNVLFDKFELVVKENRRDYGQVEGYNELLVSLKTHSDDKKRINKLRLERNNLYTIKELKGPFGISRQGDGKFVYLFANKLDLNAVDLVVTSNYNEFVKDEDGNIIRDWSEYDPSQLDTEIIGIIEDELSFSAIVNKINQDKSDLEKFKFFLLEEILGKSIPLIFIDSKEKVIAQLNDADIDNVIEKYKNNLNIYIREYDQVGDY